MTTSKAYLNNIKFKYLIPIYIVICPMCIITKKIHLLKLTFGNLKLKKRWGNIKIPKTFRIIYKK